MPPFSTSLPPSAERVQRALLAAGVETQVIHLPHSARTAAEAAAALGCSAAQIAKSLVFRRTDSGTAVLIVASGSNRVDEKLVALHLKADVARADADFVRRATGFAIGGIPPIGHDTPIETLVDPDLLAFDVVWAAAGTPHSVFPVPPRELVRITGGTVVAISPSAR